MTRTAGGHRKIARAEAIRFVRESSADVLRPDLLEIAEPRHRRRRKEAFGALDEQLLLALEQGDAEVVSGLLATMYLNGVSAAEICDGPLRHAMHRIGERWPEDPKGIFLEHRATNICMDALNRLRANFPSAATKAAAIGGAPEHDPYLLPSLMATTVLADVGLRPVNLGPNTPLDVLAQEAVEIRARLVWIALTSPLPKAALENALSKMLVTLGKTQIQVVMGGQAAKRYRVPDHPRVHVFDTMTEMAGFAKGLLATRQTRLDASRGT